MLKKPKPVPCILTVKDVFSLSPHMVRLVFTAPELKSKPVGCEGQIVRSSFQIKSKILTI